MISDGVLCIEKRGNTICHPHLPSSVPPIQNLGMGWTEDENGTCVCMQTVYIAQKNNKLEGKKWLIILLLMTKGGLLKLSYYWMG